MTTATEKSNDGRLKSRKARRLVMAKVRSLDVLVGAHPDALRDIYRDGELVDPSLLGTARGRLLTVESLSSTFMLTKSLVALSSQLNPWRGKRFERGGTAGKDTVLNMQLFRFGCTAAPSRLDGKDTLVLDYAGHNNPWPLSGARCEMRKVGDSCAIGPAWVGARLLFWWGIEVPPI